MSEYAAAIDSLLAIGVVRCRHCGVRIVICACEQQPSHWASWAYGTAHCTGSLARQHEPAQAQGLGGGGAP